MIRKRTAYARVARSIGRGIDPGRLAIAVNRRSADLARSAVDWEAFRAALVAEGFGPVQAAGLATQARAGLGAMAQSGTFSAEEVARLFGLNRDHAAAAVKLRAHLAESSIPDRRASAVLAQRVDGLMGRQLDPKAKPLELATGRRDYLRIDRVAESLEARAGTALRLASSSLRGRVVDDVIRALARGDEERVARLLGAEIRMAGLDATLRSGVARAGQLAAEGVARQLRTPAVFSASDARAEQWVTERVAELEAWYQRSAAESAAAILEGSRDLSIEERAGLLRQRIDLAPSTNRGLLSRPADTAASEIASAIRAARLDRSELFAAAQTYDAVQHGQSLAWIQAQDAGIMRKADEYWVTRDDGHECQVCGPMHGQKRRLGDTFESSGSPGKHYRNPGETHRGWKNPCRCAKVVVALAG